MSMHSSIVRKPQSRLASEVAIAGEEAVCDQGGALYFPSLKLLAVSDLHLEKGSAFARRGMLMPPYDTAATLLALHAVVARYEPRIVVSLGDSFHDDWGSERLPGIFRERLLALMAGRDWFWVGGNHDPKPPVDLPGTTVQELAAGTVRFRHEPSRPLRNRKARARCVPTGTFGRERDVARNRFCDRNSTPPMRCVYRPVVCLSSRSAAVKRSIGRRAAVNPRRSGCR
jgi:DNA ligase-associated metallophosphoesterase